MIGYLLTVIMFPIMSLPIDILFQIVMGPAKIVMFSCLSLILNIVVKLKHIFIIIMLKFFSYWQDFRRNLYTLLRPRESNIKGKYLKTNVIYKYKCNSCERDYIGYTTRQLNVRVYEHVVKSSTLSKAHRSFDCLDFMIRIVFLSFVKVKMYLI